MAIRTQVTALALLTSAALVACTAGTAGDAPSNPAPSGTTEEPSTAPATAPASPKHGRVHLPIDAGRATTSAFIAKLFEADGGSGEDAGPSYDHAYGASFARPFQGHTAIAGSWVGIAPVTDPAAENWVYGWYAYPEVGATTFTFANDQLPPGTYVARLFNQDNAMYVKTSEGTPFTVGPHSVGTNVTVNGSSAATTLSVSGFASITAAYTGLASSTNVTVGVFPTYGSNGLPYARSATLSTAEGSVQLGELLSGITYEVRVFENGAWTHVSNTKFTVSPALRPKDGKVNYTTSESIEIEFAGVQGVSFDDEIELVNTSNQSRCGSALKLDWYWSGAVTFGPCGAGTYEARLHDGVGDQSAVRATTTISVQ